MAYGTEKKRFSAGISYRAAKSNGADAVSRTISSLNTIDFDKFDAHINTYVNAVATSLVSDMYNVTSDYNVTDVTKFSLAFPIQVTLP